MDTLNHMPGPAREAAWLAYATRLVASITALRQTSWSSAVSGFAGSPIAAALFRPRRADRAESASENLDKSV